MIVHYTDAYLLNPQHKITVDLVGLGGTGSQVLTHLARVNEALIAYGHTGLHVRCWDADTVSPANIGRQLFSQADIGQNKAVVLATRVNRFFGYSWEGHPQMFTAKETGNITITCIDTAAGRIEIGKAMQDTGKHIRYGEPHQRLIYWLDLGNLQKTGQAILGTVGTVKQPASEHATRGDLPTVVRYYPQLKRIKEKDQGPSCSLAEAINKQDLFINSILANFGVNLIWKLFREGMIRHHGCFVNLDNCVVNPIPIK
jgi:PRTRC genetic system ThiF family protein